VRVMTEDSQEIELRDNAEEAVRLIDDRKGVEAVEAALTADRSLGQIEIRRVEFVGPQVGRDLQIQAVDGGHASVAFAQSPYGYRTLRRHVPIVRCTGRATGRPGDGTSVSTDRWTRLRRVASEPSFDGLWSQVRGPD